MSEATERPAAGQTEVLGDGPISAHHVIIILICFMINVIDGFDILAMSYAAPSLSADWRVEPGALGIIFSSALVGMTVGALALSPLGDKFGRRALILSSLALTSICMLATPLTSSITELVLVRFLTGLGVGGVLAPIISLATEYSPSRLGNYPVIFVQSGYAVGSVAAGVVAGNVILEEGWQSIFWYGGATTALLFGAALLFLPESMEYLVRRPRDRADALARINKIQKRLKRAPMQQLPEPAISERDNSGSVSALLREHRTQTVQLWVIFVAAVWLTYFLTNWIPVLFVNSGLSQAEGIQALTLFTLGSLIGAQILGIASTRIDLQKMIGSTFAATVILLVAFGWFDAGSSTVLNALVLTLGLTFAAGFTGLYALAAKVYPTLLRATGVGWCVGIGRMGAILSPLVIGAMVGAGWTMSELIFAIAIPPLLAAVYFVFKLRMS